MEKKRVGIMGGTFDPIHNGHLLVAEQSREQAGLAEVWFMPSHIPPHKVRSGIAAPEHRLRMVELAIADHPAFHAIDLELKREGPSYTIDTMLQLTEQYPDIAFSFIIGGDMVKLLPQWHRLEELAQLVQFIGSVRPGYEFDRESLGVDIVMVEIPIWDISSSLVREKAAAGKSLRYLVPEPVEAYMKEHNLYASSR